MKDFFISYNKADLLWAEWIAWELEEAGFTTILQSWDFRPGSNFILEMNRAVLEAKRTIAVLSPDYVNALSTQSEWMAAFSNDPRGEKRVLLPVRVREVDLKGLLSHFVYVDLVGLSQTAAKEALISGASSGRAKPTQVPFFPGDSDHAVQEQPRFPRTKGGLELFSLYSHKDEALWRELEGHLRVLRSNGIISDWNSRKILVGEEWQGRIDQHINTSDIILLLISADFIASDYIYSSEIRRALERHETGEAYVIPIILRAVDWLNTPFSRLQALPRDAKPVTSWSNRDEAFADIAKGIRLACQEIQTILPMGPIDAGHQEYQLEDVFKPSGVPTITFVEPENFYLLKLALKQPGRGVVIEGPSGIGKTTALKKAIEQLQATGYLNKVKVMSARTPEDVQNIIGIRGWHNGVAAIDDFHRLESPLRKQLVDYMKYLADAEFTNKKLVIVGIPGTGKQLVEIAFDIATRMEIIRLGKVDDEIILNMIGKGESALNIRFERKTDIVRAASGSLNIAQILCSDIGARSGVSETQKSTVNISSNVEAAISKTVERMSLKYGDLIRSFASLGGNDDQTCIELLFELAHSEDGVLSLLHLKDRRPDLSDGIERFVSQRYMDALYGKHPSYENHILYDERSSVLVIDDPQLTFFLINTPTSRLLRDSGKSLSKERNRVFISYSHADLEWLERLRVHLKPLEREGLVDIWEDTKIQAGALWMDEIKKALDSARVALLLVSANFLASDFIVDTELPSLLAAAEKRGTAVVPVILSPSRFTKTESIARFQAVNPPSSPLTGMSFNKQEELFVRITQEIEAMLVSK